MPHGEGLVVETVLHDLNSAVALAFAPDGRIFFTEKEGRLRVVQSDRLLEEPVVTVPVDRVGERGLLGVALHPEFSENQWIYMYYTRGQAPGLAEDNRVVRFVLEGNTTAGPETLIASLPAGGLVRTNHNGGNIRFGPDGRLYVTIGDVGNAESAQSPDARSGRILRLNDDGTIPSDNPIAPDNPTYALGLRNSFDLAFDPLSGLLFATENGTLAHDEINRILAGGNHGWPVVEGRAGQPAFVDPILDLGDSSVAPTGIDFAPNALYGPDQENDLFYGEFLTGRVYQVELDANREEVTDRRVFVEGVPSVTDVAFAPDGTLHLLTLDVLYRVLPASTSR